MSLSARARALEEGVTELAAMTARTFAMARCAGCDIKAISKTAKAAVTLGAPFTLLHQDAAPFESDAEYVGAVGEIRAEVRRWARAAQNLGRDAQAAAGAAAEAMAAAMGEDPPDMGAYAAAIALPAEAVLGIEIAGRVGSTCEQADRLLAGALFQVAEAYEVPEAYVAGGGVLPHDGRWITGQQQRPPVTSPG